MSTPDTPDWVPPIQATLTGPVTITGPVAISSVSGLVSTLGQYTRNFLSSTHVGNNQFVSLLNISGWQTAEVQFLLDTPTQIGQWVGVVVQYDDSNYAVRQDSCSIYANNGVSNNEPMVYQVPIVGTWMQSGVYGAPSQSGTVQVNQWLTNRPSTRPRTIPTSTNYAFGASGVIAATSTLNLSCLYPYDVQGSNAVAGDGRYSAFITTNNGQAAAVKPCFQYVPDAIGASSGIFAADKLWFPDITLPGTGANRQPYSDIYLPAGNCQPALFNPSSTALPSDNYHLYLVPARDD